MSLELRKLEERLRELEDREAIRELVSRYAWYASLADADGILGLFTPDGVLDQPVGVKRGHAELRAYFEALPAGHIVPIVSNFLITFDGTDAAHSTCKMVSSHVGSGRGVTGWYDDSYVRSGDTWHFAYRKWTTQHPPS